MTSRDVRFRTLARRSGTVRTAPVVEEALERREFEIGRRAVRREDRRVSHQPTGPSADSSPLPLLDCLVAEPMSFRS